MLPGARLADPPGPRRLGPRLLAAIVLASTALALLATGVQLYLDYSRDLSDIDGQLQQIEVSHLGSVANSLWAFDRQQTQLQLDGLVKMRDIEFAEVQGQAGEHLMAGVDKGARQMRRKYTLNAPGAGQRAIGTLTVGVGLDGLYRRMLDRGLVILATQAVKTFLVSLLILGVISRWITQPLAQLVEHARRLRLDTLAQPLALKRGTRQRGDELDAVADAMNQMSQRLHAELGLRQQAEQRSERAEEASQAKSTFLAHMSHELRTPLNGILGFAQLLQMDDGLTERQRKGLATIQSSGEHLLSLVNDILDIAKVEEGKLELLPADTALQPLLHGVADIIRVRALEKGLRFTVDLPPDLPREVRVDGRRLRQVLLNLLGNAVKFTDRGEVRLSVQPMQPVQPVQPVPAGDALPAGSVRLRFEVQDSGIGIAPEDLARLFRAFEQAGPAKRRAGGTGLGLAISRRLVQLMGGDIQVQSTPEAGSRFWFDLTVPRIATAAMPAPALPHPFSVAAPAARRITGYEGRRRRILVIDPLADNRRLLAEMLTPLGFGLIEAASVAEAGYAAGTPDLVLLDVELPGSDAPSALQGLRSRAAWTGVPVIVLSANDVGEARAAVLAAGACACLGKPLAFDALLAAIAEPLQLHWCEAAA